MDLHLKTPRQAPIWQPYTIHYHLRIQIMLTNLKTKKRSNMQQDDRIVQNAHNIYALQAEMEHLRDNSEAFQLIMRDIRDDFKTFTNNMLEIQLELRTIQERQVRMDFFMKGFMGVFLSVTTAIIIYGLRSIV